MSVVLVRKEKDKITIGADSQESSNQNQQENRLNAKLRRVEDNVYIGFAGDGHICSLLYAYAEEKSMLKINSAMDLIRYFSEFEKWLASEIYIASEDNESWLQRCQFIIIVRDRVWQFTDFYTREIEIGEFNSIGSGSQAAMACMSAGIDVEESLEAVCRVDSFCSSPIKTIVIDI